jgi:hypothetical protein
MPKHSLQPELDLPSSERRGGFIGRVGEALVGRNGQTPPGIAEIAPHQPRVAIPARPEEMQRLLGASIDENMLLTTHVRRLEAELRSSSAELAKLRGELRGAVRDASPIRSPGWPTAGRSIWSWRRSAPARADHHPRTS